MSTPKKKHTKSAVNQRRSHHALKKITLNNCSKCGQAVLPHTACGFCGNYKGKTVIRVKDKVKKTNKKK